MPERLSYHVFQTRLGWIAALKSENGLRRLTLPRISAAAAIAALGDVQGAAPSPAGFSAIQHDVTAYCEGRQPPFAFPLDFSGATAFRQRVWQAIRTIPYGETRTYGWIARQAGKPGAARAAGQAVGDNPVAIIVPCHRVIGAGGALGGFGHGGEGLDLKRRLLEMEGARISG